MFEYTLKRVGLPLRRIHSGWFCFCSVPIVLLHYGLCNRAGWEKELDCMALHHGWHSASRGVSQRGIYHGPGQSTQRCFVCWSLHLFMPGTEREIIMDHRTWTKGVDGWLIGV